MCRRNRKSCRYVAEIVKVCMCVCVCISQIARITKFADISQVQFSDQEEKGDFFIKGLVLGYIDVN